MAKKTALSNSCKKQIPVLKVMKVYPIEKVIQQNKTATVNGSSHFISHTDITVQV